MVLVDDVVEETKSFGRGAAWARCPLSAPLPKGPGAENFDRGEAGSNPTEGQNLR